MVGFGDLVGIDIVPVSKKWLLSKLLYNSLAEGLSNRNLNHQGPTIIEGPMFILFCQIFQTLCLF
jgi:hypothetical protein